MQTLTFVVLDMSDRTLERFWAPRSFEVTVAQSSTVADLKKSIAEYEVTGQSTELEHPTLYSPHGSSPPASTKHGGSLKRELRAVSEHASAQLLLWKGRTLHDSAKLTKVFSKQVRMHF
jgi:hypothetical protein